MAGTLPIEFTDRAGGTPGTNLVRAALGTLAVMQSCLKAGTLPASSGSLGVVFPALTVVVNPGTGASATEVVTTGQTVTVSGGASTDNYLFLDSSGAYSQTAVSHGAGAPATPAGKMALCYATTNAGNTAVTSVTQVAPQYGLSAEQVAAPVNQTPGAFTWSITSTIGDQIRGLLSSAASLLSSVTTLVATGTGKAAIKSDGTDAGATVTLNRLYRRPSGTPTLGSAVSTSLAEWSLSGNDEHGTITLVTSGSHVLSGAGAFVGVTATFSGTYPGTPTVVLCGSIVVATTLVGIAIQLGAFSASSFQVELINNTASSLTIPSGITLAITYLTQY